MKDFNLGINGNLLCHQSFDGGEVGERGARPLLFSLVGTRVGNLGSNLGSVPYSELPYYHFLNPLVLHFQAFQISEELISEELLFKGMRFYYMSMSLASLGLNENKSRRNDVA